MRSNWRFTETRLVFPLVYEARPIYWGEPGEPFRCWPAYRRALAYVYALRGSAQAVRSRLMLPVSLRRAARSLARRREVSLGHAEACPFLRSAPALGLGAEDVAALEALVIACRVAVLEERWGEPLALPILAGLLDRPQEEVTRILRGALGRWNLVEVEKSGGLAFARMPEAAVRLFTADDTACSPESHAEV